MQHTYPKYDEYMNSRGDSGRWNKRRIGRHSFTASLTAEGKIVLRDAHQREVSCSFYKSDDMRTVYAYGPEGKIYGGWKYPHLPQEIEALVPAINRGLCYESTDDLPSKSGPEKQSRAVEALIELSNALIESPSEVVTLRLRMRNVLEKMGRLSTQEASLAS